MCHVTAVTESSVHRNLVNICRLCAFLGTELRKLPILELPKYKKLPCLEFEAKTSGGFKSMSGNASRGTFDYKFVSTCMLKLKACVRVSEAEGGDHHLRGIFV